MSRPNVTEVACPFCGAAVGAGCRTSGGVDRAAHRQRQDAFRSALRNRKFIVEVLHDDERLGLTAGEHYVAQLYWLDPGCKVTLLARVGDGWDPLCNQYVQDVLWLRWAPA